MSVSNDRTPQLWQSFMPHRNEIRNGASHYLYSVQVYESTAYFDRFQPEVGFEKWAAIEVSDYTDVPDGMDRLDIPEGLYAVFNYKGSADAAMPFLQYIFQTWLPASEFVVDNRPHFAVMGAKYKGNSPDSEEEIWVPVRKK